VPDIGGGNSWAYRGYTFHEHLPEFGLINMNGRMYDPILGRMLSPDNYVQAPNSSQSYNRYSYVMNNPLKYNDPSGEIWQVFRAINEGFQYVEQKLNGNSNYKYNGNYVSSGTTGNEWYNDPNIVAGKNGMPIGPYGEYNVYGGYGNYVPQIGGGNHEDASGAVYSLEYNTLSIDDIYHTMPGGEEVLQYKGGVISVNGYYKEISAGMAWGDIEQAMKDNEMLMTAVSTSTFFADLTFTVNASQTFKYGQGAVSAADLTTDFSKFFKGASKAMGKANIIVSSATTVFSYYKIGRDISNGDPVNPWDVSDAVVGTAGVTGSAIVMGTAAANFWNPVGWGLALGATGYFIYRAVAD
jgi:RHS repeat-associated protein